MATLNNSRASTIATIATTMRSSDNDATYHERWAIRDDRRILRNLTRWVGDDGTVSRHSSGYSVMGRVKVGVPLTIETLSRIAGSRGRTVL